MNVALRLAEAASRGPDKTALVYAGEPWSYAELHGLANRFASFLAGMDVQPGDRVALLLPNCVEFVYCYYGVLKLGALVVSVNPSYKAAELAHVFNDSGAVVLVTTRQATAALAGAALPRLKQVITIDAADAGRSLTARLWALPEEERPAAEVSPASPAAIVYTSGTTGTPRGAMLSHGNIAFNSAAKIRYMGVGPDDRLLLFLPLFHCFGQNAIMNAAIAGGATIVLHASFDAAAVMASVKADAVTMFFGVPTTYTLLLGTTTPADFTNVRYFFSAAAILPEELERKWLQAFGRPIHQGYGLTETSPFATYNHASEYRPGSVGSPIEGVDVRVFGLETRTELPDGEHGEIAIKGPNVMLGYWNAPEETARVVRDGWFHTGDIGFRRDGRLTLIDRVKDMINVGGLKVYPAEVENVLYQHGAVKQAAVYGLTDPVMGERVCASVVLKPGQAVSPDELTVFCRDRISVFKTPTEIEIVAALPISPSGKILKRVLRDRKPRAGGRLADADTPAAHAPGRHRSAAEIEAWLVAWIERRLGVKGVQAGRSFFQAGLGSAMIVEMTAGIAREIGRTVSPALAWSYPTVRSLAAHLARIQPGATEGGAGRGPADGPSHRNGGGDIAELLRSELAKAESVP